MGLRNMALLHKEATRSGKKQLLVSQKNLHHSSRMGWDFSFDLLPRFAFAKSIYLSNQRKELVGGAGGQRALRGLLHGLEGLLLGAKKLM